MLKTSLSLSFGIIAALFWTIADMLLVGFVPDSEKYSEFISLFPKNTNSELAILMLDGSSERLFWGVCLATFSVFLYILSLFGVYQLSKQNLLSKIGVFALFVGYSISPLAHGAFAFIGLLAKNMQSVSGEVVLAQIALFVQFELMLVIHWVVSVLFSAFGWLMILILSIKKQFFTRNIILNPIITTPLIGFCASFFLSSQMAVMLGCASLNISQLLFFIYLYVAYKKI